MDEYNVISTEEEVIETNVGSSGDPIVAGEESVDVTVQKEESVSVESDEAEIVDIGISEAFPFSTYGVLDEDLEDTDVLLDGQVVSADVNDNSIMLTEVLEDSAALGGSANITHDSLIGKNDGVQHEISAIDGLSATLNSLRALKTVFSDGRGFAQYHMWADGNPDGEDRSGYFVSMAPCTEDSTDKIKICTSIDEDALGVTVAKNQDENGFPGFIGGELDTGNDDDNAYGLVCLLGHVLVRRMSDVVTGDYVIPNALGEAQKSGGSLGYQVISIDDIGGVKYACINLVPNGNALASIKDSVNALAERVSAAESNAAAAINRANEAYDLAELGSGSANVEILDKINQTEQTAQNAQDVANNAQSTANNASQIVQDALDAMEETKEIANDANETAELAKGEIDTAIASVNDLTTGLTPITTWTNADGESGAKYFVEYLDENQIQTEATIKTMESNLESTQSAISGNAKSLQSIVGTVRKYSVGERSQAYGLDIESAQNTLAAAIVYVPTVEHTESYGNSVQTFRKYYSYIWNGTGWTESAQASVMFSSVYVMGGTTQLYWYTQSTDVKDGNTTYPKETLYLWEGDKWTAVATLGDNSLSRAVSLAQQTENEIKLSVGTLSGNLAKISAKVDSNSARIDNITQFEGSDFDSALTSLQQQSNKHEASINSLAQFGHITADWVDIEEQPSGTFYAVIPEWNDADDCWDFSGASSTTATEVYCYAENTEDSDTYLQYICGEQNQWTKVTRKRSESMASIQSQATANAASITSIVSHVGADGTVTAASIMQSVNEDESEVQINADKIKFQGSEVDISAVGDGIVNAINASTEGVRINANKLTVDATEMEIDATTIDFTGVTEFVRPGDLDGSNSNSTTVIIGDKITTGAIKSNNYDSGATDSLVPSDNFSDGGTLIDLDNGCIYTPTFAIDGDGGAHFAGTLETPGGTIGGLIIQDRYLTNNEFVTEFTHNTTTGFYIGQLGISMTGVLPGTTTYSHIILDSNEGKLIADNAEITGKMIATSGYIGTDVNGMTIGDNNIHSVYTYQTSYDTASAYMDSYNTLIVESNDLVYACDQDFVYVGTDGIGLMHTASYMENYEAGERVISKQTYMAGGELFSNSAEITGKVIATSGEFNNVDVKTGTIGGFTIRNSGLFSMTGTTSDGSGILITPEYIKMSGAIDGVQYDLMLDVGGVLSLSDEDSSATMHGGEITLVTSKELNEGDSITSAINGAGISLNYSSDMNFSCNIGAVDVTQGTDGAIDHVAFGISDTSHIKLSATESLELLSSQYIYMNASAYIDCVAQQIELTASDGGAGVLAGTWQLDSGASVTSWRGAKHDIEQLDDRYSVLFDNLNPTRFKYNDGISDRYHTGLILDEMKAAMDVAGIDNKEFAAYCINNEETGEGGIRYSELIALLIKEVQTLKKEIKEIKGNE